MTTSLDTLMADLADAVGDTITEGTADSNATTTYVIDAARTEADNDWNNAHIRIDTDAGSAAPEEEERRITDFVAASDRIVVFPAFTAAVTTGDTYSIREIFSYGQYKKAINHAIRMATEWWPDIGWTYPIAAAKDTGTVASSTADSITCTGKTWDTDGHIGRKVFIYDGTGAGQWRFVIDNDADTLVVQTWETTPDTTSKFRLEKTGAAHPVICSTQVDYMLPGGTKHVYEAWIEIPKTEEMGTATSSTATTLVDSGMDWTADEHIGRYVVIYEGTGAGQARLITDNDTTSVTVSTWAINPSTDSDYKIKTTTELTSDVYEQNLPWSRIYNAYVDIAGGYIRFQAQHTEGAWVRLKYETDPMPLNSGSDTTNVDEEYILYRAASYLWARKRKDPDSKFWAGWYQAEAEKYAVTHRRRKPYGTIWQFDDLGTVHSYDSPFRPT